MLDFNFLKVSLYNLIKLQIEQPNLLIINKIYQIWYNNKYKKMIYILHREVSVISKILFLIKLICLRFKNV